MTNMVEASEVDKRRFKVVLNRNSAKNNGQWGKKIKITFQNVMAATDEGS